MSDPETTANVAREVVAAFDTPAALDAAVAKLSEHGFDDTDFSVMATDATTRAKLSGHVEPVSELADDPKVPRQAFVPRGDRRMAEAAVMGLPMYLLGVGGALGVVATGGAAGLAVAAAAAGGLAGAGIGALLDYALERHHADALARKMEEGGILLWVNVSGDDEEALALETLKAAGGHEVHAHRIAIPKSEREATLAYFQPDPFLD